MSVFKIITVEHDDYGEIFLYGVIGERIWWDESRKEEELTDLAFVRKMREFENKYSRIHLRINSPGGSMYDGNAMITAILNSKAEIHAYNDGMAASMAADIWLAAPHRHMAQNAMLMIHAPWSWTWGTAKAFRQEADKLDKFQETTIPALMKATGLSEAEVIATYYDYEDHWLTWKDCEERKLISPQSENYEAEDVIKGADKLTLPQLIQRLVKKGDETAKAWLDQIQKMPPHFHGLSQTVKSFSTQPPNMTKQELETALAEKKITPDEVQKVLVQQQKSADPTPPATPDTPPADPPPAKTDDQPSGVPDLVAIITKAVKTATEPLQAEVNKLKTDLQQLGDQPGDTPTKVAAKADTPDSVTTTPGSELDTLNKLMIQGAETGEAYKVTGTGSAQRPRK